MIENTFGSGGGILEITLDAGPDVDDITSSPQHINYEYVQHTIKGITHSFVMFDDIYVNHTLNICNPDVFKLKFFKNKDVYKQGVNLTYLDPKPDRVVHIAWEWFYSALAAIASAFVVIYVGEYTDFTFAHDFMFPVGILLGTFGIIAFMFFYYKTQDKVLYKSFAGQVPMIELFHQPRNKAYNAFIDAFEKGIYDAHRRKGITMKYRLAGELKHLRKMKEAKHLAAADYEEAMSRILSHREYSA